MENSDICNNCHSPGSCCSGFQLMSLVGWEYPEDIEQKKLKAVETLKSLGMDYFVPHQVHLPSPVYMAEYNGKVSMTFRCTKLVNGRCSDYDNRPNTCINYKPMEDDLCKVKHLKGIPIFVRYG